MGGGGGGRLLRPPLDQPLLNDRAIKTHFMQISDFLSLSV